LRIPRKASSWLIILGLLIIGIVVVAAVVEVQQAASPFDQIDDPGQSTQGFDPILVPEGGTASLLASQTAVPKTGDQPSAQASVWIPDRIVIPSIKLDAPINEARLKEIDFEGKKFQQWVAPNSLAAGFLTTSATLGVVGNTVLIGHHNIYGKVFGHLVDLKEGDLIFVYSGVKEFAYRISLKMILPERFQTIEVRLKNAQWAGHFDDERLTLVTCWPYNNNTHRLIIVAKPISIETSKGFEITPRVTPYPTPEGTLTPTVISSD